MVYNLSCIVCFTGQVLPVRIAWSDSYTYILLFFVAAAFIAYVSRPSRRGEAVKSLHAGQLSTTPEAEPCVHVSVGDGGNVTFVRHGLEGVTSSGAVSWAMTVKGADVEIKERVTYGYRGDEPVNTAAFTADLTGHEWRHVQWIDEDSGLWCAFTLHMRPGIEFTVTLKR